MLTGLEVLAFLARLVCDPSIPRFRLVKALEYRMPRGDLFNEQRFFSMAHIDPVEHVPRSRLPPSHHSLLRESDHTAWVSSKVRRRKSGTIMFGRECPAFVFPALLGASEKRNLRLIFGVGWAILFFFVGSFLFLFLLSYLIQVVWLHHYR